MEHGIELNAVAQESGWSLGWTRAPSFEGLQAGLCHEPLFNRKELTRLGGYAAADPFGMQVNGTWYVFFEMLVRDGNAVIAVAKSEDLSVWSLEGVCLRAPHHLSYPYLLEQDGTLYMIPESKSARCVDLYRSVDFPLRWEKVGTLLRGRYMDASVFRWNGRLWMLAGWHSYWLKAFWAERVEGPWHRHWMPAVRRYSKRDVRPGGRPTIVDGALVRFAQDNRECYGRQLRAMRITRLNRWWYSEKPWMEGPLLYPGSHAWCSQRIHHLDLHRHQDTWLGFTDGCDG